MDKFTLKTEVYVGVSALGIAGPVFREQSGEKITLLACLLRLRLCSLSKTLEWRGQVNLLFHGKAYLTKRILDKSSFFVSVSWQISGSRCKIR
jgi:hypothetical protein